MITDFDQLNYAAGLITNPVAGYLLEDVCSRIAAAGKLTATAANKVELMQKLGVNFNVIEREIQKRLEQSRIQIDDIFTDYAKAHYEGDYERLTQSYIPFEKNGSLQQIVKSYTALAQDDFSNATRTLGMTDRQGRDLPWKQFYQNACDDVNQRVVTGATDYNTAVRDASKMLAEKGIRSIQYESGVNTSLVPATRRNVMGFLGLMAEEISQYNHEKTGSDGWEMSAHAMSAPDHEPYQGKQYTDAEWIKLNGLPPKPGDPANKPQQPTTFVYNLNGKTIVGGRRVGTLNCGHTASPIIIGVNQPQYTDEELQKFKTDNAKGITDPANDKHYTMYEASQRMRTIEQNIRDWSDEYVVAVHTQNPDMTMTASSRIIKWREEYERFSGVAGLRTQSDRLFTVGFSDAIKAARKLGLVVPRAGR